MRAAPTTTAVFYFWVVMKWADGLLQLDSGESTITDGGSGEADEPKLKTKAADTFRDLICFQCSGSDCPSKRYPEPLRHLVTSCQACYKEWDEGMQDSSRKCFLPGYLLEHSYSNATESPAMCGIIQRGSSLSYYCFCYQDYCNLGNHMPLSWRIISCSLAFWLTYLYYFSASHLQPDVPLTPARHCDHVAISS